MSTTLAAPVSQTERITILDSLRGIAILGILLMNIPGFGLPAPACYGDLMVMDEMGTINQKNLVCNWLDIWRQSAGFIFYVIRRTGIILFLTRQEKKFGSLGPADYFFRRQLWLLVPVMRCASLDTPIPFSIELENNFIAKARLDETIQKLLAYWLVQ